MNRNVDKSQVAREKILKCYFSGGADAGVHVFAQIRLWCHCTWVDRERQWILAHVWNFSRNPNTVWWTFAAISCRTEESSNRVFAHPYHVTINHSLTGLVFRKRAYRKGILLDIVILDSIKQWKDRISISMHARESLLRVKLIGYNKQTQFNEVDLDQSCLLRFVPPARCCCTRPMSNSVGMPRTTLYMSENAWFLFSKMCKPAKISLPIHSNAKGIIISGIWANTPIWYAVSLSSPPS